MCTLFCCNVITHLISNIYRSKRRWIFGRSYPDSNETCCKRRRHCTYSHWEMQRRYILICVNRTWGICVNLYAHMRHFVLISSRFVDAFSKLVLKYLSGLASDTPHMRHPTYATPYICNTGTSSMHVSGAWNGDQSMLYGNCAGTYSSFPSDLKHRSVPIRHRKRILKIAFFFRIFPRKYAVVSQPKRAREVTVPTRTSKRQRTNSTWVQIAWNSHANIS